MHVKVANLPDRSVRYFDSGAANPDAPAGRVIILLHAFPLSADQWLPQIHRLPPGWRAVAPDVRGFRGGGSVLAYIGPGPVTMETYAEDVLGLMTHLDIPRAVIAGLSMGGYIALATHRRAPERVSGLLIANSRAGADSAEGAAGRDQLIALAERDGAAGVARDMLPKLLGFSSRRDQPDLEEAVRELIEINTVEAIASALRAMKARPDSTPWLGSIRCPTLIVSGEEDALIPAADIDAMRQAIPQASLVSIPQAGHLTNLEAPGAFNDALAAFLTGVPGYH
jgi:pimeloyl-ACP methyl ester carboxylesterase